MWKLNLLSNFQPLIYSLICWKTRKIYGKYLNRTTLWLYWKRLFNFYKGNLGKTWNGESHTNTEAMGKTKIVYTVNSWNSPSLRMEKETREIIIFQRKSEKTSNQKKQMVYWEIKETSQNKYFTSIHKYPKHIKSRHNKKLEIYSQKTICTKHRKESGKWLVPLNWKCHKRTTSATVLKLICHW